jgi:hypothetical protein
MGRSAAGGPAAGSAARRALVVLALAADLAGCGGGTALPSSAPAGGVTTTAAITSPATTAPPSSRLNVSALEFQYDAGGPVNLAAGAVTITLRNQGAEPHHGQLLRLRDGVSEEDVAAAASDDPSAAPLLDLGEAAGGPGMVAPGGTSRVTERLAPGAYLMFCLVRAPSGETHATDGMVAEFKVSARTAAGGAPRPTADLRLTDSGFRLPSPFPRHGVLRVSNQGKRLHEVSFLALPPGRGREAIGPYLRALRTSSLLQPPPPLEAAGGLAAISPGGTATVPVDLKPGSYLAICLVRGADGEPHALHGMLQTFTVR